MRYLGIDFGAKRVGISISDPQGSFAFPRETIPNDFSTIDRIAKLVKEEMIGTIVIGDSRASNGAENPITAETDAFIAALKTYMHIPIETSREAWSSVEAARFAPKGKEHDDAAAAAIILQRYLDRLQKEDTYDDDA